MNINISKAQADLDFTREQIHLYRERLENLTATESRLVTFLDMAQNYERAGNLSPPQDELGKTVEPIEPIEAVSEDIPPLPEPIPGEPSASNTDPIALTKNTIVVSSGTSKNMFPRHIAPENAATIAATIGQKIGNAFHIDDFEPSRRSLLALTIALSFNAGDEVTMELIISKTGLLKDISLQVAATILAFERNPEGVLIRISPARYLVKEHAIKIAINRLRAEAAEFASFKPKSSTDRGNKPSKTTAATIFDPPLRQRSRCTTLAKAITEQFKAGDIITAQSVIQNPNMPVWILPRGISRQHQIAAIMTREHQSPLTILERVDVGTYRIKENATETVASRIAAEMPKTESGPIETGENIETAESASAQQ